MHYVHIKTIIYNLNRVLSTYIRLYELRFDRVNFSVCDTVIRNTRKIFVNHTQ